MDIYSFIRSRDVADHCRAINKTWNTCEMAIIISRSNRSLDEKHAAWQELIDSYPDAPANPNIHCAEFESIHKKLAEIMAFERRSAEFFMMPESGAVYTYKIWRNGNDHHSEFVFSDFEKALSAARDEWAPEEAPEIEFNKMIIDANDDEKTEKCAISVCTDYDGRLYDVSVFNCEEILEKLFPGITTEGSYFCFSEFYVDIPTPFRRGDILTIPISPIRSIDSYIFVLDYLDRDNPKFLAKALRGKRGDGTDLVGWGFFVSDDGVLYEDHTFDHDALEYYDRKLEGTKRVLHYVSLFLKDDISLSALLSAAGGIMAEYFLKERFRLDSHGTFIPESLLAENRLTQNEKERLAKTDGLMPWVAGKLSIYQIEFLVKEFGGNSERVQKGLENGGGSYLGRCAGIVHDENHYEKTGEVCFNSARRAMARMVLEAYGHTEAGWHDKHAEAGLLQ